MDVKDGLMVKEVNVTLRMVEFGFGHPSPETIAWPDNDRPPEYFEVEVRTRARFWDGQPDMIFGKRERFQEDGFDSHFERLVDRAKRDIVEMIRKKRKGEAIAPPVDE
jgi:hypothetical protein